MKRPTIQDVAARAGVSKATVSHVLNGTRFVEVGTQERVRQAIAALEYLPNRLAGSLRSKRTNVIALVLTDITNPFFTVIARGVEDTASQAGFAVVFCNTDESEAREMNAVRMLLQNQVAGILLVPSGLSPGTVDLVQRNGKPIVLLDRHLPGAQVDTVRCDSEAGASDLVRLLVDLGHRRIAMLSGPTSISTSADRIAGYYRALRDAGLPETAGSVETGRFTQDSGYEMTRRALAADPRPTALFAGNNFIAIGALRALQDAGLRVPEDVALVGFDDLPLSLITFPFLTVAAQPAYQMAQQATWLLLGRLAQGGQAEPYREIVLPTELIIRRSSGDRR